jgi:hypothetical protein
MSFIKEHAIPISILVASVIFGTFYYKSEVAKHDFALQQAETQLENAKKLEEMSLQTQLELQEQQQQEDERVRAEEKVAVLRKQAEANNCYLQKIESAGISKKIDNLSTDFLPFCLTMQSYEECSSKQKAALADIENFMQEMKKLCNLTD